MDCSRARTRDPLEWLDLCPEFSGSLAHRVRERFLGWAPDLSESIRWNMLCFSGRKLVCGLSACQRHLGVTFFRGSELEDPGGVLSGEGSVIRTLRVTDPAALESGWDALRALLEQAVGLDAEPSMAPAVRSRRPPLPVPEVLGKALARNRRAAAGFERLSPSARREYIAWVGSAKRPETIQRRLRETLKAVAEGRRWDQRREG